MCNPCAHGSWPEFWEKSIPPQYMKIFFPNPCTVSKNEFFSAKIHVQYMSQKNYKILVSIQVGLKDLFDHNLNTGKVERNFCLNTASIQVGIFFTSGPLSTSLCWKIFFGPQSQFSLWEAHEGPCTSWPVSAEKIFLDPNPNTVHERPRKAHEHDY